MNESTVSNEVGGRTVRGWDTRRTLTGAVAAALLPVAVVLVASFPVATAALAATVLAVALVGAALPRLGRRRPTRRGDGPGTSESSTSAGRTLAD